MRDFTPTTEQVRGAYAAYVPTYVGPRKQEFDRWLAQHDAEVRKQVLLEAADILEAGISTLGIASRALSAGKAFAVAWLRDHARGV